MKIFNATQIRAIDAYTIKNEPIASIDLMERASESFVYWFIQQFDTDQPVVIFAGVGNNGGDGLAIARILKDNYCYDVKVYAVRFSEKPSPDFKINEQRLTELHNIYSSQGFPQFTSNTIIIDAIFGSGLSRPITGFTADLVDHINQSNCEVVSVDIASGLFCDAYNPNLPIIKPDFTVSFQFPKLSFLLPQNDEFVGYWLVVDIGLDQSMIDQTETPYYFVGEDLIRSCLKPRAKFSHKGTFGHCLFLSGSYGKIGAAILATKAALRTGSGLVTAHLPSCGYQIMQQAIPEIMCSIDQDEQVISHLPDLSKYQAIAIGPGIGQDQKTKKVIEQLLTNYNKPIVIDADALNLIAYNQTLLSKIPKNSILTPHPKEFERLVGKTTNHYERLKALKKLSEQYQIIVVLKGAHSAIALPNGTIYFNSTGNAGMATAGSGDVLTGIIASLLGQGYEPEKAAILGVYLHGMAGDIAHDWVGEVSMIATDIIDGIAPSFQYFLG